MLVNHRQMKSGFKNKMMSNEQTELSNNKGIK